MTITSFKELNLFSVIGKENVRSHPKTEMIALSAHELISYQHICFNCTDSVGTRKDL